MQEMQVRSQGQEDPPGIRNGTSLQYSWLGNPMDREVWQATVHSVKKSQTQLKQLSMDACSYMFGNIWSMIFLVFSHSVVSDSLRPPWTVACQAPLSIGFFSQEYWSRVPFPIPEHLSNPGIEPASPAWQVASLPPCRANEYSTEIFLKYLYFCSEFDSWF